MSNQVLYTATYQSTRIKKHDACIYSSRIASVVIRDMLMLQGTVQRSLPEQLAESLAIA